MKFRTTALVVSLALLPMAAVTSAEASETFAGARVAPAKAAGLQLHALPTKIVLNQSYENVRWSVSGTELPWLSTSARRWNTS